MNPRFPILLALAVGAGLALAADPKIAPPVAVSAKAIPPAAAGRTASAVAPSARFDAFRIVADRNIFNPNRAGRREGADETPARVDTISLVGTMDYEKGLRAFFDGSDAAFRKALRVGESVDKYTVTRIVPTTVELEREGEALSMRVGQQLRRSPGADWTLVGEDVARLEAEAQAAKAARIDPSAPPVIPANVDAVTRKLMERRQKELKQ